MEIINKIKTISLKSGGPVPPGSSIFVKNADGTKIVESPVKFLPVKNKRGEIVSWERKPIEDFI